MRDIIEFLTNNPAINLPIVLLGGAILFLFFTWANRKLVEQGGNYVSKKINISQQNDLLQHDLFIRASKYYRIAEGSNFGDEINDDIFRIILKNKVRSTLSLSRELLESMDLELMGVKELEAKMYENNRAIVDHYNYHIRHDLKGKYGEVLGDRIFHHVMNSPQIGFNPSHAQELDHLDAMIADVICKENTFVFHSNMHRFELYLYFLNSLLYVSMIDAENMFYNFNGELQRIKESIQR